MKPTLFLSHAVKDSRSVGLLKDRLVALTNGAIDIFVSSDGQSLPFGRNWVHQTEEALDRAKLMFTFLSPSALQSRWVSFESGFAYAKGIRVVPVGILGVDLASVGPPLGLLQGFNIASAPAMNNLVKIINDTFQYSCKEAMTAEDYQKIFLDNRARANSLFGKYSELIDEVAFRAPCERPFQSILSFLKDNNLEFYTDRATAYSPGLSLQLHDGRADIRIDPLLSALTFPILEKLIPFMEGDAPFSQAYDLSVYFTSSVCATGEIHKLGARLYGSDLTLDNGGWVVGGALRFSILQGRCVEINALYRDARLSQIPAEHILSVLFDSGVLFLM